MAINLLPLETNIRRIVEAIRQLTQGRSDAVFDLTLNANSATTVVTWINCSTTSRIFLTPLTANAAAAIPTTYFIPGDIVQGGFIVTHANNAQVDKTFAALVIGG